MEVDPPLSVDAIDESLVTLDTYNSDLNLVMDESKFRAYPLTKEGFAYMEAGARATHGCDRAKFCFEVKLVEHLSESHLPTNYPNRHILRVGFSLDNTSMQLGEHPLSYGYDNSGKITKVWRLKDFGPPLTAGDCILAVADMRSDPIQIGFAKNGEFVGWAYEVRTPSLLGKALFPHVLSKNCSFEVNFGQRDEPYYNLPQIFKDFTFIGCLPPDQRVGGIRGLAKREDCEVFMMCGLPGAGKSVWAENYSAMHPEKKYNVLGTNNILKKMRVVGLPRERKSVSNIRFHDSFQMANNCLHDMLAIASKLCRNYILDQTNVYVLSRRRKMQNFHGFKRIAVVVVPTEEEYKRRCETNRDERAQDEVKEKRKRDLLKMKGNFSLPKVNDIFDYVIFTELSREDAEKIIRKYNEEARACFGSSTKHFRRNRLYNN